MEKKITALLKSHGFTKLDTAGSRIMTRTACTTTVIMVTYDDDGYDIEVNDNLIIVSTDLDQLLNFIESVWPK